MSEQIKKLLGSASLSEEAQLVLSETFDAAVSEAVEVKVASALEENRVVIETQVAEAIDAKIAKLEEETANYITDEVIPSMDKKVNEYLGYVATSYIEEQNKNLVDAAKVEIAEGLLSGFSALMTEHGVTVDEDSASKIAEAKQAVVDKTVELDESIKNGFELSKEIETLSRSLVIERELSTLTEVDKEKVVEASNKLTFESKEIFAEKVNSLVEKLIPAGDVDIKLEEEVKPVSGITDKFLLSITESISK
jgi:hypothetical protein